MSKSKTKPVRLIVATSDTDADMLYATKFWAPDPFIFLERNGRRTLVLSDLEIDRGRKQADADELLVRIQKQEQRSRAIFETGEISKADLVAQRLQLSTSAQARLEAMIKSQQALVQLEDALQGPLGLPAEVW